MLVLDTHTALWWTLEPARLGRKVAARLAREDAIGIPTIVFWEAALLVRKGRLELDMTVTEWAQKVSAVPRVVALQLSTEIALLADALEMHPDPADRFIAATAITHRALLATKDSLLGQLSFLRTVW